MEEWEKEEALMMEMDDERDGDSRRDKSDRKGDRMEIDSEQVKSAWLCLQAKEMQRQIWDL